jgi:aryl-alcohol dehydrogenase-like predicted oxidoreductase
MQTRRLGISDLNITPIGFGAWAIGGGDWLFGWGPQDDAESIATIQEAVELGINWIDTAAVYGLGRSETVVGQAIKGMNKKPLIFTKCERVWDADRNIGKSLKADSIRKECEASLKRLDVETIDLYQIHWPEPDEDIEEGWRTLDELKKSGKVRWIAVSNFSVEQMKRASKIATIASLQPPYSMLRREIEAEILPYCESNKIGVIAYSPMASGLLTGTWTKERHAALPDDDWRKAKNRFYQEPMFSRNLRLVELLKEIGATKSATPGQIAIAWVLRQSAVTGAIVGARKPGQLKELVGAAEIKLNAEDLAKIENFLADNPE